MESEINSKINGLIYGDVIIRTRSVTPDFPIKIRLSKIQGDSVIFRDSCFTDKNGKFVFDSLEAGRYEIGLYADEHYCPSPYSFGHVMWREISKNYCIHEIKFEMYGWHHFSLNTMYEIFDTTKTSDTLLVTRNFYNDGIRDTINWQMDTLSIPSWLNIHPVRGIYPPQWNLTQDIPTINVAISKITFPENQWFKDIIIPLYSQYETDTLYIKFFAKNGL